MEKATKCGSAWRGRHVDAGRLLGELSRSHGVIPEKYEVTKAKDGSDRIKCPANAKVDNGVELSWGGDVAGQSQFNGQSQFTSNYHDTDQGY